MDYGRVKIVFLALVVLSFSKLMVAILDKSTFVDIFGWFAIPLQTLFGTILAAWFIVVALAINLIFYDQSTTPMFTIGLVIVTALVLKSFELGWNAIP